jgi:hypothetical protein
MIARSVTKWVFRGALLALTGVSLAACGGGNSSNTAVATTAPTTTTTTPSIPSTFGTNFSTDYAASSNSTPTKVASGDIIALSLTTAPTAVK